MDDYHARIECENCQHVYYRLVGDICPACGHDNSDVEPHYPEEEEKCT